MPRRSSLQVNKDRITLLADLEKELAKYQKIADDRSKPVHLAAILVVAKIAAQIALVIKAIKAAAKRRKKL